MFVNEITFVVYYNTKREEITWGNSTIRSWLNGYGSSYNTYGTDYSGSGASFISNAFTASERSAIKEVKVKNDSSQGYDSTDGGADTYDKLFLLSYAEVISSSYAFDTDKWARSPTRFGVNTQYVKGRWPAYTYTGGTAGKESEKWNGNGYWWLRSPGYDSYHALSVNYDGSAFDFNRYGSVAVDRPEGVVRPALHISPSSSLLSYAGTVKSDGTVEETGGGNNRYDDLRITGFTNTALDYKDTYTAEGNQLIEISTTEDSIYLVPRVSAGASYKLYKDKECSLEMPPETTTAFGLEMGENYFYIRIIENDKEALSIIKVTKREMPYWAKMLSHKPAEYDHDLALICAKFSRAAEQGDNEEAINALYEEYEFDTEKNMVSVRYDGTYPCSIGLKDVGDFYLIFITARGTHNLAEAIGDTAIPEDNEFFSKYTDQVYGYARLYEEKIVDDLQDFFVNHEAIIQKGKKIKYIITGHSLGGAAANLLAARLDILRSDHYKPGVESIVSNTTKDDIYAYTFGAIDSITDKNVLSGFENIHNIYNYWDTYGPNGWGNQLGPIRIPGLAKPSGASSYGRFGNNVRFEHDFCYYDNKDDMGTTWNHNIEQYIRAIEGNYDISEESVLGYGYKNIGVLCPVDVEVLCKGSVVGRIKDNAVDKSVTTIPMYVYDEHKFAAFPGTGDYEVRITATDDADIKYFVEDYGEAGDDIKIFENISVKTGDMLLCEAKSNTKVEAIKLYALDDNGKKKAEVLTNGKIEALEYVDEPELMKRELALMAKAKGFRSVEDMFEDGIVGNALVSDNSAARVTLVKGEKLSLSGEKKSFVSSTKQMVSVNSKGVVKAKKSTGGRYICISYADNAGRARKAYIKVIEPSVKAVSGNGIIRIKPGKFMVYASADSRIDLTLDIPLITFVDKSKGAGNMYDLAIGSDGGMHLVGKAPYKGNATVNFICGKKKFKIKIKAI